MQGFRIKQLGESFKTEKAQNLSTLSFVPGVGLEPTQPLRVTGF
jgi:hypothetical protein